MSSMEEDFRKMNSDGYEEAYDKCFYGESNVINGTASEYEMPGNLSKTNYSTSMPDARSLVINGDKICNTCNKADVCMYKGELAQAAKEITQISERKNVFVDVDIKCKHWFGNGYGALRY